MHSALPPATKHINFKLQKEVKSTQKQPSCKAHAENNSMKKVVKSKVVAQKRLHVMV